MKYRYPSTLLLAAVALGAPLRADVVTDWNQALLNAVKVTATNPPRASRAMAMVHVAMFEAVNGIDDTYTRYHVTGEPASVASIKAAAATAGHRVLSSLFPTQVASFDALLSQSLAGIPPGPLTRGIDWGIHCADDILALRASDNSNLVVPYFPLSGPGYWVPTPPAMAPALLPNWPLVTPFCMSSGAELRSSGPPALSSAAYTAAFNEVKDLGRINSVLRTPEQTEIALFWADGGGTVTPPGHWLRIAQDVATARHNTVAQNARLFALLSIGVADAAIVAWDNKYNYHLWRPITAIRQADTDGNINTDPDPTWAPLIVTPPFPSYTSGHSTFSATSARILARVFRNDAIAFATTSDGLPNVTRTFTSFSQAASEAGQSRIYGGIHWQFDNQDALAAGASLGDLVVDGFLKRIGDLNDDDRVDGTDLAILLSEVGQTNSTADLDGDGIVDHRDTVLLVKHLDVAHHDV
jgi:membrane-associated phospholipid phosphatase